jgi:hypothetical protein
MHAAKGYSTSSSALQSDTIEMTSSSNSIAPDLQIDLKSALVAGDSLATVCFTSKLVGSYFKFQVWLVPACGSEVAAYSDMGQAGLYKAQRSSLL